MATVMLPGPSNNVCQVLGRAEGLLTISFATPCEVSHPGVTWYSA